MGQKKFFLVTAMGSDPTSMIFYSRTKGETEDAVKEMNYEALHIFRPASLEGPRKHERMGDKISLAVLNSLDFIFKGSLKKYKPIHADTVAKAMVKMSDSDSTGIHVYPSDLIEEIGA